MTQTHSHHGAKLVPYQELPLPEVTTQKELQAMLKTVYEVGLPAFLIRSTGLTDTGAKLHPEIRDAVISALPAARANVDKYPVTYSYYRNGTLPFGGMLGQADFHHDMRSDTDTSKVRVHRTTSGAGEVMFANSALPHAQYNLTTLAPLSSLTPYRVREVEDNLSAGLVDTDIIHPKIYTANLFEDDTVVFPVSLPITDTHEKPGPIWHRFDTSTVERSSLATIIEPTRK